MGNYPTSNLTLSELVNQVMNDPQATQRELDLAERTAAILCRCPNLPISNIGRGERG